MYNVVHEILNVLAWSPLHYDSHPSSIYWAFPQLEKSSWFGHKRDKPLLWGNNLKTVYLLLYLACLAQASFKQRVEGCCSHLSTRDTELCQNTHRNTHGSMSSRKTENEFTLVIHKHTTWKKWAFTFYTSFILQNFIHHLFWEKQKDTVSTFSWTSHFSAHLLQYSTLNLLLSTYYKKLM